MHDAQHRLTMPLHYGSQADLGRYSMPDGPVPNWSELLPQGRTDEAREAQEAAVAYATADMRHVAECSGEAGADGLDFDTSGAAGDAELPRRARGRPRLRATYPTMSIEVGMASEFVLGMHGAARVRRRAPRRPVAARPAAAGASRPARPSSARP